MRGAARGVAIGADATRLFIVFLVLAFLASAGLGCGKKGEPLAPIKSSVKADADAKG